jgi:hypothetical protein
MNITAFVLSALLMAIRAEQPGSYTPVDLSASANFKINAIRSYPTGRVKFEGVPFELPASRMGLQTEGQFAKGPESFRIEADVRRVTAVHILLQGTIVRPKFRDLKVGEIVLEFKNGKKQKFPITAWRTLRDTWASVGKEQEPLTRGNPRLNNVYKEPQSRGGVAALGLMDMYSIDLEKGVTGNDLKAIEIRDTSKESVGDIAPSLIVTGITVKHE